MWLDILIIIHSAASIVIKYQTNSEELQNFEMCRICTICLIIMEQYAINVSKEPDTSFFEHKTRL